MTDVHTRLAGNSKAFGPLPDGWDANVLPVTFVFEPRQ